MPRKDYSKRRLAVEEDDSDVEEQPADGQDGDPFDAVGADNSAAARKKRVAWDEGGDAEDVEEGVVLRDVEPAGAPHITSDDPAATRRTRQRRCMFIGGGIALLIVAIIVGVVASRGAGGEGSGGGGGLPPGPAPLTGPIILVQLGVSLTRFSSPFASALRCDVYNALANSGSNIPVLLSAFTPAGANALPVFVSPTDPLNTSPCSLSPRRYVGDEGSHVSAREAMEAAMGLASAEGAAELGGEATEAAKGREDGMLLTHMRAIEEGMGTVRSLRAASSPLGAGTCARPQPLALVAVNLTIPAPTSDLSRSALLQLLRTLTSFPNAIAKVDADPCLLPPQTRFSPTVRGVSVALAPSPAPSAGWSLTATSSPLSSLSPTPTPSHTPSGTLTPRSTPTFIPNLCKVPAAIVDSGGVNGVGPAAVFAIAEVAGPVGPITFVAGAFQTFSNPGPNADPNVNNIAEFDPNYAGGTWSYLPNYNWQFDGVGTQTSDLARALAVMPYTPLEGAHLRRVQQSNKLSTKPPMHVHRPPLASSLGEPFPSSLLIVGGQFEYLGDGVTVMNHIAAWDGVDWYQLGEDGLDGSPPVGFDLYVNALAVFGNTLYAGGSFRFLGDGVTSVNRIASWTVVGGFSPLFHDRSRPHLNGFTGLVQSLAFKGTILLIAGNFKQLRDEPWPSPPSSGAPPYPGTVVNRVAQYNPATGITTGMANGLRGGNVHAIAVSQGGTIVAGGNFSFAISMSDSATLLGRLAQWTGAEWAPIAQGVSSNGVAGNVRGLAFDANDNLVVGGNFKFLGDGVTPANFLARWNSTANVWSSFPTCAGFNGVDDLIITVTKTPSGKLLTGGWFIKGAGGSVNSVSASVGHVAQWDSTGNILGE